MVWIVSGFGILFVVVSVFVRLFLEGRFSVSVWNVGLRLLFEVIWFSVLKKVGFGLVLLWIMFRSILCVRLCLVF